MKLRCFIILYLIVNEFYIFESHIQNKNELDIQSLFESLNKVLLRMEVLEKSFKELHEETVKSFNDIQNDKLKSMDQLSKYHILIPDIPPEDPLNMIAGCTEKCDEDPSCTSVFWSNSSDSECRFVNDKSTLLEFTPGEIYYCKDCETTIDLVLEAEYSGVIKLTSMALNKSMEASSYANAKSGPSKAVDGDQNTWFSSEALRTKGEPWLMVDLGQRYLVALIRIHVRQTPIYKVKGGHFKVCLVDAFDRNVNPCNLNTEILRTNKRLRTYHETFDAEKIIMGRYLVLKKLKEESLEIVELEIQVVLPVTSYICAKCRAQMNTVCDNSKIHPECRCSDKFIPIDGDPRNGCKDPCVGFNTENAVCSQVNYDKRNCTCNEDFYVVKGDACTYGCKDPCSDFKDRNTICLPVDFESYNCQCKDGYSEIFKKDPCFGCRNPCTGFREIRSECIPVDSKSFICKCETGTIPIHENDPCFGCKEVCPSHLGYKAYNNNLCLKYHNNERVDWLSARAKCISEGGDLFTLGYSVPIQPEHLKDNYWIGVRTVSKDNFKRVTSIDQSPLPKASSLWASGDPDGGTDKCVLYEDSRERLLDDYCSSKYYFICQLV